MEGGDGGKREREGGDGRERRREEMEGRGRVGGRQGEGEKEGGDGRERRREERKERVIDLFRNDPEQFFFSIKVQLAPLHVNSCDLMLF